MTVHFVPISAILLDQPHKLEVLILSPPSDGTIAIGLVVKRTRMIGNVDRSVFRA